MEISQPSPNLGSKLAGKIDRVGKNVTKFQVGNEVFATAGISMGTYAEYVCLPESGDEVAIFAKPVNMTFEEAASVLVGGINTLFFLQKAHIQPGDTGLINGAGGSIGTMGIQLAKVYGASVIAVDSANKLNMMRSIGADDVIDYRRDDFTQRDQKYDVIFDLVCKGSYNRILKSLTPRGMYLVGNPSIGRMIRGAFTSFVGKKKVLGGTASNTPADVGVLKQLIEQGKIHSVIDQCFPLSEIVQAHRYVESGQKKGNVVIRVNPE